MMTDLYNIPQTDLKHCDDLSDAGLLAPFLKSWIDYQRLPAIDKFKVKDEPKNPFAFYLGERVVLTMASRFGDVGIRSIHSKNPTYDLRVCLTDLRDFHHE